MMPMWVTNDRRGFTLLEVAAVIVLLGLTMCWALPDFYLRDERIAIKRINSLINDDLRTIRETSRFEQLQLKLTFGEYGYCMELPDTVINRNFKNYGFRFLFPQKRKIETGGDQADCREIVSRSDGSMQNLEIAWKTAHFNGRFIINEKGLAEQAATAPGNCN